MLILPYSLEKAGDRDDMEIKVVCRLHDLIDEHGISMRELARRADIRPETLNKLANQQRTRVEFAHIKRIAEALGITDLRKIIDITVIEVDDDN